MKKYFFWGTGIIIFGLIIIYGINLYVLSFSEHNYFTKVSELPSNEVGLVFGASVIRNSTPSYILKSRLESAAEAYKQGKIKQIIVSGDNSIKYYNEPKVMKNYLISLGVNSSRIYPDYAGFDTYDSIYRAKKLFFVKNITLFTQDMYLKRAMYIAQGIGLDSIGMQKNKIKYPFDIYVFTREVLARVKAFLDVEIFNSTPIVLGDPLRITPIDELNQIKKELLEK